jgi:sigma-B regulation protein RsbU (phosphoserine phosphatase)
MVPVDDVIRVVNAVRSLDAFGRLPEPVVDDLIKNGQLLEFQAGQFLMKQGQSSDSALILIDGFADVLVESKYGPVHLASLEAPALVGEIGVFANVPRTASIQAKTPVQTLRISGDELHRVGQENPRFLSAMMSQIGRRLQTFNKAMAFYSHALTALERDEFDVKILDDLMHPIPELVDFSRSFRHLAEQIILRRTHREEMASARAIQLAMLPEHDALDHYRDYVEIDADMRSAHDVGGDLYDFFPIDPQHVAVTVGDVCGKGIPAALYMAMTQTVMRYMLRQEADVGAAATAGNALLAANNRERMFATFFCAVLDLATGVLSYCSCGHHPPIILRNGKDPEKISVFNLPLGLKANTRFLAGSMTLEPGDRLLLFTDGFVDAINGGNERFGNQRLLETVERLRALPSRQFIRDLMKSVDDFASNAPQFDDLTAVLTTLVARKR